MVTFRRSALALPLVIFSMMISSSILASSTAMAATFKRTSAVVKAADGSIDRRIYTEISRGRAGAPVVVLLNGLIYEIQRWYPVADRLADQGLTVVRMSYSPQPESLRLLKENETPSFNTRGLELTVLADDVKAVLDHHRLRGAVNVVGLSYGSAVATEFAKNFPKRVDNLILLSPLVVPLDTYNPASLPLRSMLDGIRFWEDAPCTFYGWLTPWLCDSSGSTTDFWYDSFYNYFYEQYLNQKVTKIPMGIDAAIYKKSVFQLVRAVRNYDLKKETEKLKNVHFVIAEKEDKNLLLDQRAAWSLVPPSEKRSFAEVTNVVHALPDEAPVTTSSWIYDIVSGEPGLSEGDEYVVEGY